MAFLIERQGRLINWSPALCVVLTQSACLKVTVVQDLPILPTSGMATAFESTLCVCLVHWPHKFAWYIYFMHFCGAFASSLHIPKILALFIHFFGAFTLSMHLFCALVHFPMHFLGAFALCNCFIPLSTVVLMLCPDTAYAWKRK